MTLTSWIKRNFSLLATFLLIATLLVGCAFTPNLEEATQADFWLCEDGSLMETRQAKEQLWLQLPASSNWVSLPQKRAASGARYSNGKGTSVWNKGHRSRVATPEKTWEKCQRTASGKPGKLEKPDLVSGTNISADAVVLKATGHNPGWTLEARQNGELLLLQNFGTQRITFKDSKIIEQDLIKTISQAKDSEGKLLEYKVENILCIELNTGEPFPHRVELRYLNKTYQGCGQSF